MGCGRTGPKDGQLVLPIPRPEAGIAETIITTELCIQTNHAIAIDIPVNRATARSTIQGLARSKASEMGMILWGTYQDDIVRDGDGEWRFGRRTFRFTYVDAPTRLSGKAVRCFVDEASTAAPKG